MTTDTDHRDLSTVDLTDLDLWAEGPPHELFAQMRAQAPVRWNPSADGSGFWSLTRQAEINQVSLDTATFSSARAGALTRPDSVAPLTLMRNLSLFKDDPEHTQYRGIVKKAFLPRVLTVLNPVINKTVEEVLGRVLANGDTGQCDLVTDIAQPITITVLGRMLGSADKDQPKLQAWSDELRHAVTHRNDASATFHNMSAHFMASVNEQLIHGVESLAKSVAEAEVDGNRLNEEEIAVYFGMLLYLGYEPTCAAISGGLLALIERPEQCELLRTKPALLKASKAGLPTSALAEILRWTSPLGHFARTATHDTVLGGQKIKADDRLIMWYPSANRDSDAIAEPDVFDINRTVYDIRQIAFGPDESPHHCQGAFLANQIVGQAIGATLSHLGDMELAGPIRWFGSPFANSLASVPVQFRPAVAPRPAIAQPRGYAHIEPAAPPVVRESVAMAATSASASASASTASSPAATTHAKPSPRPGFFARLFGKK